MLPAVDEAFLERAMKRDFGARFLAKICIAPNEIDGCWLWTGTKLPAGYGMLTVARKSRYAHRIAVELSQGIELSPKQFACHSCDRPSCVRPSHLFIGSAADNTRDAMQKNRLAFGDRAGATKYSEATIAKVVAALKGGETQVSVARRLSIPYQVVHGIAHGRARIRESGGSIEVTRTPKHGEGSAPAVLSNVDVLEIVRRSEAGERGASIARSLKISEATVSRILSGERWSHLTGRYRWARVPASNDNAKAERA